MPSPFSRTTRSLQADPPHRSAALQATGILLLAGWGLWATAARVTLYETAPARIEAAHGVHPVQLALGGMVVATPGLRLGGVVRTGDVLLKLDARRERLELQREQTRLASLQAQRAALRERVSAQLHARSEARSAAAAAAQEAGIRVAEAESAERTARRELERATALRSGGHLSDAELERVRSAWDQARLLVSERRSSAALVGARGRADGLDAEGRLQDLRRELAAVDAEIDRSAAAIRRWRLEVDRRTVRAPVAGTLARVEPVVPGQVLGAGTPVAYVTPPGALLVTAELPVQASGRVRPGQAGRLRLDGYPWTRHGVLEVRVLRVGTEPGNGRVRVELSLVSVPGSIPVQHGLTGQLEVGVGTLSPAGLFAASLDRRLRGGPAREAVP
ncbi:MAG TPA: HlyD family efflux transporter periplasmic adaptor subunit [Longimicrobiaceae bacterium]|nr:HlyD family efflux transporter periplasmic adaptor subunit [Longimicrobiaceae bacterium]